MEQATMRTQSTQEVQKKYWAINKSDNNEDAEVMIYGTITGMRWDETDVSAYSFVKDLKSIAGVKNISLRVNSGGGDVFEATAIYNQLVDMRNKGVNITAYIDGLAASAASFIIMAANKIVAGIGSMFMIHNPSTVCFGTADDMAKAMEFLGKAKDNIIDVYMTKTKRTKDEIAKLMDDETWYGPNDAKVAGFIDEVTASPNIDHIENNIKAVINDCMNQYKHKDLVFNKIKNIKKDVVKEEKLEKVNDTVSFTLEDLKKNHQQLLDQYKEEILSNIDNTEILNLAAQTERERIQKLDSIPVFNDEQKEIVNKAKYEAPRDYKDIIVDFYNSAAFKAQAEIEKTTNDQKTAGINDINPSVDDTNAEKMTDEEKAMFESAKNWLKDDMDKEGK